MRPHSEAVSLGVRNSSEHIAHARLDHHRRDELVAVDIGKNWHFRIRINFYWMQMNFDSRRKQHARVAGVGRIGGGTVILSPFGKQNLRHRRNVRAAKRPAPVVNSGGGVQLEARPVLRLRQGRDIQLRLGKPVQPVFFRQVPR